MRNIIIYICVILLAVAAFAQDTTLTVTSDGRVGIGTPSPTAKLEVVRGPSWTTSNWSKSLKISAGSAIQFDSGDAQNSFGIGATKGDIGALYFWTTAAIGTEAPLDYRMILLSDGRVGIGTTSPQAKLHVSGVGMTIDSFIHGTDEMGGS